MKILFFINCSGNGAGGHYHSLDQVSKELSNENEINIISVGKNISPIISSSPFFLKHIFFTNILDIISFTKNLKKVLKETNPDILHFFDNESLNNVLLVLRNNKVPFVLNKCGGPNPIRSKWQFADGLILFSYENYNWFMNNQNYDTNRVFLIPNRVQKLKYIPISQRVEVKNKNEFTFVRVSRLGGAYEKTLLDTFNLVKYLSEKYPIKLIIVGKIQNQSRFDVLKEAGTKLEINIEYITDQRANKGSDFLYLADFVIGTGRSMMEAMSLGIPCLAPAQNAETPILITKSNFKKFFDANFSERAVADDFSLESNMKTLEASILNRQTYQNLKLETEELFETELSSKQILSKYSNVYKYVLNNHKKSKNIQFLNLKYLLRFVIKAIKLERN